MCLKPSQTMQKSNTNNKGWNFVIDCFHSQMLSLYMHLYPHFLPVRSLSFLVHSAPA